jgi:hypothetical protein
MQAASNSFLTGLPVSAPAVLQSVTALHSTALRVKIKFLMWLARLCRAWPYCLSSLISYLYPLLSLLQQPGPSSLSHTVLPPTPVPLHLLLACILSPPLLDDLILLPFSALLTLQGRKPFSPHVAVLILCFLFRTLLWHLSQVMSLFDECLSVPLKCGCRVLCSPHPQSQCLVYDSCGHCRCMMPESGNQVASQGDRLSGE